MPRCYIIYPLFIYIAPGKISFQKIISPVNIIHMGANKIVQSSHQEPFYCKNPGKNMIKIGQGEHNIDHKPIDMKVHRGLPHLTLITPVMIVFYKDTPNY